jgi:hypothetical protein
MVVQRRRRNFTTVDFKIVPDLAQGERENCLAFSVLAKSGKCEKFAIGVGAS